ALFGVPWRRRKRKNPAMSSFYQLDFEKPVLEIERQIESLEGELRQAKARSRDDADAAAYTFVPESGEEAAPVPAAAVDARIGDLRREHAETLARIYATLTPWDTVRVSRHPRRPQTRDYIDMICTDFCELHGDRRFGDDPAMVTGFARIGSAKCMVIGHHKG